MDQIQFIVQGINLSMLNIGFLKENTILAKKSLLSPTEDGHKKIGTLKVNHFQIRIYIIFYLDVGIFTPNLDLHLKDLCVLHVETM
jgi:hypothetical protein